MLTLITKKRKLKLKKVYNEYKDLYVNGEHISLYDLLRISSTLSKEEALQLLKNSPSQLKQDIFVLVMLKQKHQGFFVEFGATNGRSLSNTFLLESKYNWTGILAEPAKGWHDDLKKNRKNACIDFRCVSSETGSHVNFREAREKELSTIDACTDTGSKWHQDQRKDSEVYQVETITLMDLLHEYNAPETIDYLSIDTEGSEIDILSAFDFSKYKFLTITVEHNYTKDRELIYELLIQNGYKRVLTHLSKFDDWYVHTSIL